MAIYSSSLQHLLYIAKLKDAVTGKAVMATAQATGTDLDPSSQRKQFGE